MPAVSAPGFTATVTMAGVVPAAGVTVSQLLPENGTTVNFTAVLPVELTRTLCVAVVAPAVTVKVSWEGDAAITGVCAGRWLAKPSRITQAADQAEMLFVL